MRKFIVPAVMAIALSATSLAFAAATTTNGAIKSIDTNAHTVTLSDGQVYYLPSGFKESTLKTGEKVTITWELQNGKHMASEVKAQ